MSTVHPTFYKQDPDKRKITKKPIKLLFIFLDFSGVSFAIVSTCSFQIRLP